MDSIKKNITFFAWLVKRKIIVKEDLLMIDNLLKPMYQKLFLDHKEQRKNSVNKSNLVRLDGSLNRKQISALAQFDTKRLMSAFNEETLAELITLMSWNIDDNSWEELACILYMYFYMIHNRAPALFKVWVAHDEVFRVYCKYLYQNLCSM